jgi:phage major head subunit gpT-like protein
MVMTRAQFNSLMTEGLRKVFFMQYNDYPLQYQNIYEVVGSKKKSETDQIIAGIGMLDEKGEGENITYADMIEGYDKTFTHTAFAKGLRITRELIDDDMYGVIKKRVRALARAARYRKEYDHAKLFNYASATTYFTGADGLALLSASHTLAGTPGTTWSNYSASTDLSWTALETAINAMRRYVDDLNMLIQVEPTTLLIPPELEMDAIEILNSTNKPDTADNNTNAMKSRLKIVTWPFITDTNAWFVLCGKSDIAPISFDRIGLEFDNDGDFDSKDLKVSAYTRYSNGFVDPRFCYGSMGAS